MPTNTLDPAFQGLLNGRYIATLGTENADGSIHLTAVWYLFEAGSLYVATSSRTQKARNAAARPKASLMVDARKPGDRARPHGCRKGGSDFGNHSQVQNRATP